MNLVIVTLAFGAIPFILTAEASYDESSGYGESIVYGEKQCQRHSDCDSGLCQYGLCTVRCRDNFDCGGSICSNAGLSESSCGTHLWPETHRDNVPKGEPWGHAKNQEECQARCQRDVSCVGILYSNPRCYKCTRYNVDVNAYVSMQGFVFYAIPDRFYYPEIGRACSPSYEASTSLDEAKDLCNNLDNYKLDINNTCTMFSGAENQFGLCKGLSTVITNSVTRSVVYHKAASLTHYCSSTEFPCNKQSGISKCIPYTSKCDGKKDCWDESDETGCEDCTVEGSAGDGTTQGTCEDYYEVCSSLGECLVGCTDNHQNCEDFYGSESLEATCRNAPWRSDCCICGGGTKKVRLY